MTMFYTDKMQDTGYIVVIYNDLCSTNRYGSRSVKLGQHLLPELFASRLGSMSVLHQVARKVYRFAYDQVRQRQPAVDDTASASQRYQTPVCPINQECFGHVFHTGADFVLQLCPVMSLGMKMYLMLDAFWMFSGCTDGT